MQAKQRVLIIDDEKTNLKILSDILRDEVEVILAKDGAQGIRKARELAPDLILLDVVMAGMSGFDVITKLKHDAITSAIPVIFITSLGDVSHEERGLLLGACDYIQKPFHAAIVLARIQLHLQLARQRLMLERLANIDPLTEVANRRRHEEVLASEWRVAMRNHSEISLVMVDIDNFKHYNDRYGHAAGDRVLQQVAQQLSAQLKRPRDLVARYGGEEFIILLPENSQAGSMEIMENCRTAIENLGLEQVGGEDGQRVTISIGGITCRPGLKDKASDALKMADDMLYLAKHQGKNRVIWFEHEQGESRHGDATSNGLVG
ncbi:GGDEF domain-containing response regulator [Bowmanella dokdonensis]|uniref:diguanylate cyclase n=1 Tax=Bowmanella dokdonensis TaxID=751969 RepID=A0A939IQS6_9ALTE|nr:diguanylate cyclase [Bowmanella dokdonensis]MBN7825374.1 diguanylate cyclase [Bowmanella dokdonensis]